MKKILKFVYIFFMIGLESLGNMSAVMVILEENLIKKNKLVEEEDIIDAVTLSRIGPGAITANAVAYLGNKRAGFWGGVLATICYTIAPLMVMVAIYGFLEKALKFSFVQSALKGCLIYICIIFLKSTIEMGKGVLKNKFCIAIYLIAVLIELIFKVSCIWIVAGALIIGIIKVFFLKKKKSQLYLPYIDIIK